MLRILSSFIDHRSISVHNYCIQFIKDTVLVDIVDLGNMSFLSENVLLSTLTSRYLRFNDTGMVCEVTLVPKKQKPGASDSKKGYREFWYKNCRSENRWFISIILEVPFCCFRIHKYSESTYIGL